MLNYEGAKCLVCEKEMQADEDIVVCPECGTPYHRACYRAAGRCISSLHETGGSWQKIREEELKQKRSEEKRQEQAEQAAERERGEGPQLFNAEIYDGVRIDPEANCAGLDPTEDFEGVSMQDLSDFVGINRFYYLPLFRLMKKTGKRISINLSSLLFPHLYFANRKMWFYALLSLVLKLLTNFPVLLSQFESQGGNIPWFDPNAPFFAAYLSICKIAYPLFFVVWGLFANFLYYRHSIRCIKKIRRNSTSEEGVKAAMKEEGGSSFSNMILIILIELAGTIALYFCAAFIR